MCVPMSPSCLGVLLLFFFFNIFFIVVQIQFSAFSPTPLPYFSPLHLLPLFPPPCFFMLRGSSTKMEVEIFLCSRFRAVCPWHVFINLSTVAPDCVSSPRASQHHLSPCQVLSVFPGSRLQALQGMQCPSRLITIPRNSVWLLSAPGGL